jgi:hypothetical protein
MKSTRNWLFWQLKTIEKTSSVRKKKRLSNIRLRARRAWFWIYYTDTEFNASRLLVDNLRKWIVGYLGTIPWWVTAGVSQRMEANAEVSKLASEARKV